MNSSNYLFFPYVLVLNSHQNYIEKNICFWNAGINTPVPVS